MHCNILAAMIQQLLIHMSDTVGDDGLQSVIYTLEL